MHVGENPSLFYHPATRVFLRCLAILLVLLFVGRPTYKVISRAVKKNMEPTRFELACGEGFDNRLADYARVAEVTVIVPRGCSFTKWLTRPRDSKAFWIMPDDEVGIQKAFGDGSRPDPMNDSPLVRNPDSKLLTGVRFQNTDPKKDIPVRIQLR